MYISNFPADTVVPPLYFIFSIVLALPVFTDGLEMEKCYAGKHEDMLYTYMELLKTVKELGASGIVINPLGVSYYVPVDIMKQLITM